MPNEGCEIPLVTLKAPKQTFELCLVILESKALLFDTVYRSNPEPLWKEVAERYQQIVEKDMKLLQYTSTANVFNANETGQTAAISLENKCVDNNQCLSLPVMFVTPESSVKMTVATGNKKTNANTDFPKIVEVFSLNPSAPVRHFQEHVTLRVAPNEIIVEPHASQSLGSSNERTHNTKISENVKEKLRNLVDGHTTCRHDKVYFQMEQCGETTNPVDLKVALPEVITGNPTKVNLYSSKDSNRDIDKTTAQQDDIPIADNATKVMQHNNNNFKCNKERRKRESIFGPRRVKKKSRVFGIEDIAKIQHHGLEDKTLSIFVENQNNHCDNCDSMANGNINNIDPNYKEKEENTNKRYGDNQTISSQEKHTNRDVIEKNEGNASSSSEMLPYSHGNSVRQNKILHLKEKLARQEQELQKLKRRKRESADARIENCTSPTRNTSFQDDGEVLRNINGLNYRGQIELTQDWSQTDIEEEEEKKGDGRIFYHADLDINPGKLEDLKEIFRKVIKSFRIFETRLYITKTGVVIGNGDLPDLQSKIVITEKSVFTHVDNRMTLLPQDFPSKEDFLLQLGLVRV